jgi:hypothetical protein
MQNQPASAVLGQLNTAQIKLKLLEFPQLIFNQRSKVRNARDKYQEAEADRAMREAELISIIASETHPITNKAMYSNAESRQAELLKRKSVDADYLDVARTAKQASEILAQCQDELDRLFDEYKSWGFVSELVANEVNLWAREPRESLQPVQELRPAS